MLAFGLFVGTTVCTTLALMGVPLIGSASIGFVTGTVATLFTPRSRIAIEANQRPQLSEAAQSLTEEDWKAGSELADEDWA